MRVRERVAFLREIEDAFYDQQEITRLFVEEEKERDRQAQEHAELELQARELYSIAVAVLHHFGLAYCAHRFLGSSDGLALLANCCNYAAKRYDQNLYFYKPLLLCLAIAAGAQCWQEQGIVYIETLAQVSFHVFEGEDFGLPEANGRLWCELDTQMHAGLVAHAWLHGWSMQALKRILLCELFRKRQITA